MSKEYKAGISFSDGFAQLAVLEIRGDAVKLAHLEEYKCGNRGSLEFLSGLVDSRVKVVRKVSRISIALDPKSVYLHQFPIDSSLDQTSQNEHIRWELSNFIPDFAPKEFISDVHILRTHNQEQVADIFVVTARRSLVFEIQKFLTERHLDLHLIDANHFGAQYSLLVNYSEVRSKTVGLASFIAGRVDVGIMTNGRLTAYRYGLSDSPDQAAGFLDEIFSSYPITDIFYYGTGVTTEIESAVSSTTKHPLTKLIPFRRLPIASSFRNHDTFAGQEHRFVASIGCALRKQ